MPDECGEEVIPQSNQNWGYNEAKCLVEIWAHEEIRVQQQLSVTDRKQTI